MKSLLSILFVICFVLTVHAGDTEYSIRKNRSELSVAAGSNEISLNFPAFSNYGSPDNLKNYGKLSLQYNRENHSDIVWDNEWRYTVKFHEYIAGVEQTSTEHELMISYVDGEYIYSDYHLFDYTNTFTERKVKITDVIAEYKNVSGTWVTALDPDLDPNLPNDIHVQLSIKTERYYELDPDEKHFVRFIEADQEIRWPFIQGAEEYDVEWVFIDADSREYTIITDHISNATTLAGDPFVDFSDNYQASLPFELKDPTRVNLKGNKFKLDMTYPQGMLFFRMRPVARFTGVENTLGEYESLNNGVWTYSTIDHPSNEIVTENHIAKYEIDASNAFSEDQNWLYGVNFAEDAKSMSILSYYDGVFGVRQNLSFDASNELTLISEAKYDYEGRKSVSIIPSPVMGKNFNYQSNFNESAVGVPYEKESFDKTVADPLHVSTGSATKGSAQYFSPYNTLTEDPYRHAIPDAGGYTFSQVKFNRDATGRISENSSVGSDFAIGSNHTTKYFYGTTNGYELHRLFGKEVGEVDFYKKNYVVDQNGQVSVTYLDNHGRVIASALAGDSPDNLVSIGGSSEVVTASLSVNNQVDNEFEQTSKQIIVNYGTTITYTFDYDIDGVLYGVENPSNPTQILCIECVYDFEFTITDPNGIEVFTDVQTFSKDGPEDCGTSAGPVNYHPSNGTLTYGPFDFDIEGEYSVIKKLTLNEEATNANIASQIEAIIGTEEDFIQNALSDVDISGCFDDCDSYCEHLAGVQYNLDNPLPAPQWEEIGTAAQDAYLLTYMPTCLDNHCNIDEFFSGDEEDAFDIANGEEVVLGTMNQCEGIKSQMVLQVSPGGIEYEGTDFWTLFPADVTTLDLYTAYNEDGTPATGATVVDDILYFQDPANFQEEWAEEFIYYHREYCHYSVCLEINALEKSGINSMEFDIYMQGYGPWTSYTSGDYYTSPSPDPFEGSAIDLAGPSDLITELNNVEIICTTSTYTGHIEAYTNDTWACQGYTDPPMDQWGIFYGKYQNIKQLQINEYKEYLDGLAVGSGGFPAGCLYYDDGDQIVDDPALDEDADDDGDFDEADIVLLEGSLGAPAISFNCNDICADKVAFWMASIPSDCINSLSAPEVVTLEGLLEDYCTSSCSAGNIGGWLYNNGSPEYTALSDFFDLHADCYLSSIEVTEGTFTLSDSVSILIENPCLITAIDALNAAGYSLPLNILSGDPMENCGPGGTGQFQFSGTNTIISTQNDGLNSCLDQNVLSAFYSDGTPLDITTLISITDVVISQVDEFLAYVTFNFPGGVTVEGYVVIGRCFASLPQFVIEYTPPTLPDWTEDCINEVYAEAIILAQEEYANLYTEAYNAILAELDCMTDREEEYSMTYTIKEYQYTLFYYDQAGNLAATVPPEGVDVLTMGAFDTYGNWNGTTNPSHQMMTLYEYNGINTMTLKTTPDGGTTNYYYDNLYRLRFSQDAEQLTKDKFTYVVYDELGRITEAGEAGDGDPSNGMEVFQGNENDYNYPLGNIKRDRTLTIYEDVYVYGGSPALNIQFTNAAQENLRNRIGAVVHYSAFYEQTTIGSTTILPIPGSQVITISSYSYDFHGNVKEMVQTNEHLKFLSQQHKRFVYDYDLLTNVTKEVTYQSGVMDEWRHKYHYDANNRLVRVWTSDDGEEWEMDAKYFYYLHGPVARMEIGHDKTQGVDFVFNEHGWLKGVNSTTLRTDLDAGLDGLSGDLDQYSGADAFGFSLGYFDGDYSSIEGNEYFANTGAITTANGTYGNLYNGNISNMVTAIKDVNENKIDILGNAYRYDQLQRLSSMDVYAVSDQSAFVGANSFAGATPYLGGAYATSYSYDKNGNLMSLTRNAHGPGTTALQMDDFSYSYLTGTNKLDHVYDHEPNADYGVDIQQSQSTGNYDYYENGRLKYDIDEGIDRIDWTVTGKVRRIIYNPSLNKPNIEFVYDGLDNRVIKVEGGVNFKQANYTYYTYDATGNVISTYERISELPTGVGHEYILDQLSLGEQMIYGSARIGVKKKSGDRIMANREYNTPDPDPFFYLSLSTPLVEYPENFDKEAKQVGQKYYELSNHLSNVLAVITDRKLANTTSDGYEADVVSYSDYYPFGMTMPGRNESVADSYRYGYNGKEDDEEVKNGKGKSYDYGMRIYDPRIGRWSSPDPFEDLFAPNSPYSFAINSPIYFVDPDGGIVDPWVRDKHYKEYVVLIKTLNSYSLFEKMYIELDTKERSHGSKVKVRVFNY